MKHSPALLMACWFTAATAGALLGIVGFLALTVGVMA